MPLITRIYHGERCGPQNFGETPADVLWLPAAELIAHPPMDDKPIVLLVDASLEKYEDALLEMPVHLVLVAMDVASERALEERTDLSMAGVEDAVARRSLLDAACKLARARSNVFALTQRVMRRDHEFYELSRIGISLMHERDRKALLELILEQGTLLTDSDGAGLLFLETDENGTAFLVPKAYEFESLPDIGVPNIRYEIDSTSIVGHAALTKAPVIVDDAHNLPRGAVFSASAEFKRRFRYHTRSILAVPMLDQNDAVLGVIFFINRKSGRGLPVRTKEDAEKYCLSYTDREVRLARSLAAQAAVSIENSRLYAQIEILLESMVKAAVSAIDERDPATAGHSIRVAALTTALAEAVDRADTGPYADVQFTPKQLRELRFAALLHDLGKVTVREDVLLKSRKLPVALWERVSARFELIRRTMQLEHAERHEAICRSTPNDERAIERVDRELNAQLQELARVREVIRSANEPTMLAAPVSAELREIARRTFKGPDGVLPYLTPEELHYLEITRGTLDPEERAEVEAHVLHTKRFLAQIPWTNDLKNLVTYACGHHEKLNGTGYPLGLRAAEIPIESRMIALADMFDALTESDRPYKPAVSAERALEIIRAEADAGSVDRDLVAILADSEVYREILDDGPLGRVDRRALLPRRRRTRHRGADREPQP